MESETPTQAEVRKNVYAFVHDVLGVKMTHEQTDQLREILKYVNPRSVQEKEEARNRQLAAEKKNRERRERFHGRKQKQVQGV